PPAGAVVETPYGKFTAESMATLRMAALKEPLQLNLMRHCFTAIECVDGLIDVGANLGLYSIAAATAKPVRHVTAFEPSPDTFKELEANIALNRRQGMKLVAHNLAVSDSPGEVSFLRRGKFSPGNKVMAAGGVETLAAGEALVSIGCVRIDDLIDLAGPRDSFLKMDVEGHEISAIKGAGATIAKRCAVAQIELLRGPPDNRAEVKAMMEALGFTFLFRCGADHIFLHADHAARRDEMEDMFWGHAQKASKLLARLALNGPRALQDERVAAGFGRFFNRFPTAVSK
ncbi:MAG: FkbM family methyltransferase, partial [Paracoccaceae bacterium]